MKYSFLSINCIVLQENGFHYVYTTRICVIWLAFPWFFSKKKYVTNIHATEKISKPLLCRFTNYTQFFSSMEGGRLHPTPLLLLNLIIKYYFPDLVHRYVKSGNFYSIASVVLLLQTDTYFMLSNFYPPKFILPCQH